MNIITISMKKIILTASLIVLSNIVCSQTMKTVNNKTHSALNNSNPKPEQLVQVPTIYDYWTGFYGGPIIGGIFNKANVRSHQTGFFSPDETCNASSNFSTFSAGIEAGYSYQFNSKIVLGVEGDFLYNFNSNGVLSCNCVDSTCNCPITLVDQFTVKNRDQGSIRARVGYDLGKQLLPFLFIGDNIANFKAYYSNEGGNYYSKNTTRGSFLAGAGLEWGFASNLSAKVEYYYTDYGSINMALPFVYGLYDPNGGSRISLRSNQIKAALSYWF